MDGFKDFVFVLLIVAVIIFVLEPYFSLTYLKNIYSALCGIRNELEKMNNKNR